MLQLETLQSLQLSEFVTESKIRIIQTDINIHDKPYYKKNELWNSSDRIYKLL